MSTHIKPEEGAWYVSKKPIDGFDLLPFSVVRIDEADGVVDIEFKNGEPATLELNKWATYGPEEDIGELDFFLGDEIINIDDNGDFIDEYADKIEFDAHFGIHEHDFLDSSSDEHFI